ncbi:MAG: guanylate kinase [Veillonellales bacterium]
MAQQGVLLILSGPSGAGKGTVCRELLRSCSKLNYSISATTRQPRTGEVNGVNYWFRSPEQFKNMIKADELLEWAEVYGNFYGTPRRHVSELLVHGEDVVLEIDIQGAMQVKEKFAQGVLVYIIPPSLDELANRIYKRGTDSLESIKKRLNCVNDELSYVNNYDYVVVNDEVSQAVEKVQTILSAEKCRVSRNQDLIRCIHKSNNT